MIPGKLLVVQAGWTGFFRAVLLDEFRQSGHFVQQGAVGHPARGPVFQSWSVRQLEGILQ